MRIKRLGTVALIAVAAASISTLGVWAGSDDHAHSDSDYLFAHLQARSHAAHSVWLESSLAEMLPSRQFSVNGSAAGASGSGLVIGQITDVRAGRGFSHIDDAPKSTEVAFDSADALWRTVEITLAIEEAWGKVAGQKTVTFAMVIDGGADSKTAISGLRSLDRVIVALDRRGFHAYNPRLYSISHNGDLFGTVDAQGNIQLPVMEHATDFMQGLDTVAELRAEAGKAPQTITVDIVAGTPVRQE